MGKKKVLERDPVSLDAARARILGYESYGKYMPHKKRLAEEGKLPGPNEIPDMTKPGIGCGPIVTVQEGRPADTVSRVQWDTERGYQMWLQGWYMKDIAKELGVSLSTVKARKTGEWVGRAEKEGRNQKVPLRLGRAGWDTEKGYRLWIQGWTMKKIAKELGTSPGNVFQVKRRTWEPRMRAEGIQRTSTEYPNCKKWDREKGYRLWLEGMSAAKIAQELGGVSRTTVAHFAEQHWLQRAEDEGKTRKVIPHSSHPFTWDQDEGYRKWRAGVSMVQIAKDAGVSVGTVNMCKAKHWVKRMEEETDETH